MEETYQKTMKKLAWLDKCKQARRLDSNFKSRVKEALDTPIKQRIPPMNFNTLESRNKQLYEIIRSKVDRGRKQE